MSLASDVSRQLALGLVQSGLQHVVLCPGSRSAPLAYAFWDLAEAGLVTLHVRHDERIAGFTAVGIAHATGLPAAVVVTSGTAVANLHPAVLESHHAGVPLIVLAADRPARLWGTWANQASDHQLGMFGAATRLTVDLRAERGPQAWAAAGPSAVSAAVGDGDRRPGPVHLNLALDEPLLPDSDEPWVPSAVAVGVPRAAVADPPSAESVAELVTGHLTRRTVVVAGDGAGATARAYAEAWGLPLLAEPSSGSRGGPQVVAAYRLLLDRPGLGGAVERVVVFGRPTLSRSVNRLLERADVDIVLVQEHPTDPGPLREVLRVPAGAVSLACSASSDDPPADPAWLGRWLRAGDAAAAAIDEELGRVSALNGLHVARDVARATCEGDFLVLAASNPVRDVDLVAPGWQWPASVVANRGLAGIDGTVSTAVGMGLGSGRPGRVLVGDIAFLVDVGALILGPQEQRPDLTVVVLNDNGGGIFSLLEPGADGERDRRTALRFERVFGTPHGVEIDSVATGFGATHVAVSTAAELYSAVTRPPQGLSVVEVRVDRSDLRSRHAAIEQAVSDRVDELDS